jgi:glycosyltransferase involved in cell wall biosynthesis
MFMNGAVEKKFVELLEHERPDLVYSVYLSSSMLPKILHIAKKRFGIPVVYRLSDFHMFCASYLFFRNGEVCQACLTQPGAAIKFKCVQGSTVASLARVLQIAMIRSRRLYNSVDRFVCPSRLMETTLLGAGYRRDQIDWVPTFTADLQDLGIREEPSILYFGKLTREKGVEVLVRAYNAWKDPKYPLCLVGHCSAAYRAHLLALLDPPHRARVTISEPLQGEEMWRVLRSCSFVVQPAIWLENMPNTLLEALSAGKPVVASEIGSLTELVAQGENGYLVPPGDVQALSGALERMASEADLDAMGKAARRRYEADHTEAVHLRKLFGIFSELTDHCQLS